MASAFSISAPAAEFAGAGVGAIPDNDPNGINITFPVSGIANPVNRVRLSLTMTHTWIGDLEATLTSPEGMATLVILARTGLTNVSNTYGDSSGVLGTYVFEDTGGDFWTTASDVVVGQPIPPGNYSTSTGGTILSSHGGCSTSMSGAFDGLSGAQANGTWTLHVADLEPVDTGAISSAILTVLDDSIFTNGSDRTRGNCKLAQFDFTGTGRSSYLVVRNTGGGVTGAITWQIQSNDGTTSGAQQSFVFGNASNYFLAGDFDGDGIYDAAVWSPGDTGTAKLMVRRSSRPTDTPLTIIFGQTGDDPTHIGDYDGDGFDDFAVYRTGATTGADAHTLIHLTRGGPDRDLVTGEYGAFAAGGVDYTGDGRADMAIQADAGGGIAFFRIFDGTTGAIAKVFDFGTPTDYVVVGNHSGNALYDITVVRNDAGNMLWSTYDMGTSTAQAGVHWGMNATDYPISGDYDGDGLDDYAIWRPGSTPGTSIFYIRPSTAPGSPITVNFGETGDYPVANSRTH